MNVPKSFLLRVGWIVASALWLLGVVAAARAAEHPPEIRIHGNYLLGEEIYRAIVYLPPGAAADQATANVVVRQLFSFLYRSGFVLATVEAHPIDNAIDVTIDEGRLDKIVFIGASPLMTLRLKLELNLPNHIFNQISIRRQLKQFGEKYGFHDVTYKLVPTSPIEHTGPQLPNFWTVQGSDLIPPESRYELWITVGNKDWGTGMGISLSYDFPDGFEPGIDYRSKNLLFNDDRWLVESAVGGELRTHLDSTKTYLAPTRFKVGGHYYTPPLFGIGFRPFLWLVSDLTSRQRADLKIDTYYSERLEGSLNLGYDIMPGLFASVGGGVGQLYFFGIVHINHDTTIPTPIVSTSNQFRPFALARVEWQVNPNELHRDYRHLLLFEERHIWSIPSGQFDRLHVYYQKIFSFGWNDLRLKSECCMAVG